MAKRSPPNTLTIGDVEFTAVRMADPRPHWRYSVGGVLGLQSYATRPAMWGDLERAFTTRGDKWAHDWQEFVVERAAPLPTYGAGWHRMTERLGTQRMEEIRQDVLREQEEARAKVRGELVQPRDRRHYHDYPKSK